MDGIDVVIVGAGPTGLALGCDLARRGIRFRIVDRAGEYFIGSKAKGLQPRTLEVMHDLGIIDRVLANGRFHIPFRAYDGATVLGERDIHEGRNPTPATPYASPLLTPQWRLEEALRGLLERSGARVELGTELVSLEGGPEQDGLVQDREFVRATLATPQGEEQVSCRYLIAADGGRSLVRRLLQVPFEGQTWADERMYVGDVRLRGLDREAWHSWARHPDGWLALCPLPSTDMYQIQAQVPPGEDCEPSLDLFRQIVRTRAGGMEIELTDAPWMSLYRVNVRMVSRYRVGRIFLAGDAAHVHSPAGGQGMNTGIQDAYNLGWKLARVLGGAPESLLDTYEEERLPVAAHVLGLSSRLYRQIAAEENEQIRRDSVTLQLGITYREMSLSAASGESSWRLAAGDRAPDAVGLNREGESIRLFDLLRGPHLTLLCLSGARDAAGILPPEVRLVEVRGGGNSTATQGQDLFVDSHGHFADAYGGGGDGCLLVRPDGYIGWTGSERHLSGLREYLGRISASR